MLVRNTIRNLKISKNMHFPRSSLCSDTAGPLSGIKILDFTRVLAGPFATMILGDLGANIIKVEKPGGGDDTRLWGPPFVGNESAYFFSVNRNKKSIVLDLKTPKGSEIARNLVQRSDILVENFVPGVMEKLGLDYDSLKSVAPKLIYCSLTGYGSNGPYKKKLGYDVLAASLGGLVDITGVKDGEPCKVGVAMTDLATGLYLHGAIMAALLHRHKNNEGQKIECNLLSTQVSCMVNIASSYLNAGLISQRRGTAHESIVPYQAFKTKDGYLTVGVGNEVHFKILCETLKCEELLNDEKYQSNALRVENRESIISLLSNIFITKTNSEWLAVFEGVPIPYAPVNTIKETFSDPQVIYNNMIRDIKHSGEGNIKVVGPAVKYSTVKNDIRSAPPILGEHTSQILKEAGYTSKEIEEFKKEGIVEGC
ncbi:UNVERIFIED_CONTAM: hypothetical protein RMT77_013265 [Armadillidium vulgare]